MADNPNRYNATSYAYEFSLFEDKELSNRYTVHKKSKKIDIGSGQENGLKTSQTQIYRIKKQRNRARMFQVTISCFLLVLALSVTASLIFNQVRLSELTDQFSTATQQLEESKSIYTQLQMRSEANLSLATVENFVKQNLNMRKIDQSQLIFVELSKGDKGEVVQDSGDGNFFVNIWNKIKNFLS